MWLITGFGPFQDIQSNPSAEIAQQLGLPYAILEVSFSAVDEFLRELDPGSFDRWLMIGVHGSAELPIYETRARNAIGPSPDVQGLILGPGSIDPSGPPALAHTLFANFEPENGGWGVDAGAYLCNYLFYRGLRQFPEKKIGFLHIPRESEHSLAAAQSTLTRA